MSADPKPAINPFARLWALGYRRLVPIVPPLAELSPHSSLYKRPASRGKAVGEEGPHGWRGFNWHQHETVEADCDRWCAMGAGVGCKTGQGLVAIDVDTLDPDLSALAYADALEILGPAPRRVGRAPKVLLPYRVSETTGYRRVSFASGPKTEMVEMLGEGRQFVMGGIHPGTMEPYRWPDGVPAYSDLTLVSHAQIDAFFERLVAIMPEAQTQGSSKANVDRALIDQASLTAPLHHITKVLAAIPNTEKNRKQWIDIGTALRAALPDDPEEAFALWWEFSLRHNPDKDYEAVVSEWNRLPQPPWELGAPYLYGLASKATGENQMPAERYFDVVPEGSVDTSGFPEVKQPTVEAIVWIDPASWAGKERPEQRWFVQGLVPDGEVTLLTGAGGIGKTLLVQQLLVSVAMGLPFLGRDTVQARSMSLFCEDNEDVLHARIKDICLSLGVELSDLSANMRVSSRKYMDNLLSQWDRSTSQMRCTTLFNQLAQDALAFGARLVVIDTIADTFGGDEINRQQVRQFIQACAGKLAQTIGGAVILLGHPSKSGEQTGDGTSGSTAWHATVRSRLYLEKAGKEGSGYRKLSSMKANYGPAGDSWLMQWRRGVLEVVSSSEASKGVPETASALHGLVFSAVRAANADGVRMALARTSKYGAERILRRRAPDVFAPYSAGDVEEALQTLFATGQLVEGYLGKDANRNPISTICPPGGSVFD